MDKMVKVSPEVFEKLVEMCNVTGLSRKALVDYLILGAYPRTVGKLPHPADAEPVAYGYGRLASHPLPAPAEEPK